MAPSAPHVCPITHIALAAWTITSVMIKANPLTRFLHHKHRAPPILPRGKLEVMTVWFFQTLATGLVLTVDDEDQNCVGAAVWTSPVLERGILARFYDWLVLVFFGTCINLCYAYYGNQESPVVSPPLAGLIARDAQHISRSPSSWKKRFWAIALSRIPGICIS